MSRTRFRSMPRLAAAAVALFATFSATRVEAQADAGSTKGLFFGLQYAGASVSVKDAAEDLKFGSGFGLHAGLGISDNVAVLVNFDRSAVTRRGNSDDLTLKQYDALLRMYLLPGASSPVRVFATAGATGRAADRSTKFEGIAPTAGAGVHLGITPHIAITGTALWTFGNLTRLDDITGGSTTKEDFRSTGTRVQVGASLYLFR
ncbi:MAG TPA: hypothetical protein DGD08_02430 [Gemmatimonas aurantiaca]|uniref:Outer membrane protein beta-barrel domain-containing protein n=2 Tax=Gemmatimonas aurantiaca TaxID=173480 RepID=C1AB15_GEMAT|nr:outer membrane beta-barrel protein [Gemmatimonas aurantiaca]BAH39421.1 hypothetical protein GAU_2379 [Gemmatimonas aurantiaca T-27]HCT56050.1 hypothetical protein [Gemmatimonas aurantiaca]